MVTKTQSNGRIPKDPKSAAVTIPAPNFHTGEFRIVGTAPYVQNKFAAKARAMIRESQEEGSKSKNKKKKEPKNFQQLYEGCIHRSVEGWAGIPAPAFRNAMVSACRVAGFQMTKAKLSVFVEADGIDAEDGTPLVKITKGEPEYCEHYVRNETGVVDLRPRAMWKDWEAVVRIRWDGDQFSLQDTSNLLMRVGQQVGIGEGRPDSRKSCGMGWGLFELTSN